MLLMNLWFNANIPTTQKPKSIAKFKILYQEHVSARKNKRRKSERQTQLQDNFSAKLENYLILPMLIVKHHN